MLNSIDIAEIGALVGDPARAAMLQALLDGRAYTAGELAYAARVSAPTASLHLRKLAEARMILMLAQGRHRYFRLASPLVGQLLEAIAAFAATEAPPRLRRPGPGDVAMRTARLCYDHLAGRVAVALADGLVAQGALVLEPDGGEVTQEGLRLLTSIGIALPAARPSRRAYCRPCLDWSERRFHLGGQVGAALAAHGFEHGWLERLRDTRAVVVTRKGEDALLRNFGVEIGGDALAA